MILTHLIGLTVHPSRELSAADRKPASLVDLLSHMAILTLIPAVAFFITSTKIGWSIGNTEPAMLSTNNAALVAILTYFAIGTAVFLLAAGIQWMAKTFGTDPDYLHCLELAVYTAAPMFAAGLVFLIGDVFWIAMLGLLAVGASVFLLYRGIPIFMHIPEEKGFVYASATVTVALCLFIGMMASTVIIWDWIFG